MTWLLIGEKNNRDASLSTFSLAKFEIDRSILT